jgi:ABC-2 type transport system permease protein
MNWEQFRAILWLRWRLTRNQLTRGSGIGAVIAGLAGVLLVVGALGIGAAAALVGTFAMKTVSPMTMMFVWDGIALAMLFIWLLSVLAELQRSESVDLTRLLHLPVSLKQVFVFNYLVSLVSLGTIVALAGMLGLSAGLTFSQGPLFLLALPLVTAFIFMVTAWIYCLRGWLLSLMINPRRRRAMVMWITLGIILLGQSPQLINLAWQRKSRAEREARHDAQQQTTDAQDGVSRPNPTPAKDRKEYYATVAAQVHPWVPLLWLPNGARGLAAGEILPALWGGAGMFALGWLGLHRAYRATLKYYRGEQRVKPLRVPASPKKALKPARNWVACRPPWVRDDTAALALAQLRSMTRAPEVRMMLAMGLFLAIFMPLMIFWRGGTSRHLPEAAKPFLGTGAVVMVLFALLQLVCNQFGCDRDGFRGLVLLPTPRERLLFGKNLAFAPLAVGIALLPLAAMSVFANLSVLVVLASGMQFAAAFFIVSTIGNLASILIPYRIAAGSLKPSKQSWRIQLLMMLVHFLFPVVIAPVFIPPILGLLAQRWAGLSSALVNFLAALVLVGAFGLVYWVTLSPLGRLLQRRETNILRAVTEVTE